MNLNYFMTEAYSEKNDGVLSYIYFSYEDEAINPCIDNMSLANNCFLYKNANASQEKIYSAIDKLSDTGWTVKMQKICDNTYSYLYERISYIVPLMFGIFLLTIVCLVCVMTLNATDYMKTYSIYYLCGMNWSDMKKILIGTTNPSKVRRFSTLLEGYDIEFCTLNDLDITTEPNETGTTPKENAVIKAAYYGKFFDEVICHDSGLFFDALPLDDKRQPALNVRSPQGVRLNDEEMIAYYSQLIHSLGGKCSAYYMDGFAVCNQGKISSFMEHDPANAFYMVERSNGRWNAGWPLDSLSIDKRTGLYFTDEQITAFKDGKDAVVQGEYREKVVSFLVEGLRL